jgi:Ca2+-binding RTX toxin-like protein
MPDETFTFLEKNPDLFFQSCQSPSREKILFFEEFSETLSRDPSIEQDHSPPMENLQMKKSILRNTKASVFAELITFASLAFTLGLVLFIAINDIGRGNYAQNRRNTALLSDQMPQKCLQRTRANDNVSPRQAGPYNCFKMAEGNDRVTVDKGDNIIYPGPGRDTIITEPGSRETQIVYESGNDTLYLLGGHTILDMRKFTRDEVSLYVKQGRKDRSSLISDQTVLETQASNLVIKTPLGEVEVNGHFKDAPLGAIVLKDEYIFADDIYQEAISDQETEKSDRIDGTPISDYISPGTGNDIARGFEGDDIFTYTSGRDRYDPGEGRDILELPDYTSQDVSFSIPNLSSDIILNIDRANTVRLVGQLDHPPSSEQVQFSEIHFADTVLRDSDILARAISDQGSPRNDHITGTRYSEAFHPGTGANMIEPGTGSDTIYYEGGIDTIIFPPEGDKGTDVLVLEEFDMSELVFSVPNQLDLLISTPTGTIVIIKNQMTRPAGDQYGNIEIFRFKNGDVPDKVIRGLVKSN